MDLVADRFARVAGRVVLDLATGLPVRLRRLAQDDRVETGAWADRCAQMFARGEPVRSPIVDYGHLGRERRFEAFQARAWRMQPRSHGQAAAPDGLLRPLLQRIEDLLESGRSGEPRVIAVTIEPRVLGSAWRHAARHARLRGFVPLCAAAVRSLADRRGGPPAGGLTGALASRHVLLLHATGASWGSRLPVACAGGAGALASLAVLLSTWSPRPHVMLVFRPGVEEALGFEAVRVPRWDGWRWHDLPLRAVREARAGYGAPVLARQPAATCDPVGMEGRLRRVSILVERGRHAAAERLLRDAVGASRRRGDAAAAAEASLLLGRLLLARGRLDPAVRALTDARDGFHHAADGIGAVRAAIALGLAWTDAARLVEAEASLRAAAVAASELGEADSGQQAALALARCLYWQGQVTEADRLLNATALQAEDEACGPGGDDSPGGLRFHSRPAAVAETAPAFGIDREQAETPTRLTSPAGPDQTVVGLCLQARTALGLGDFARAAERGRRALARASAIDWPGDRARAHGALAEIRAALGDLDRVRDHVRAGLDAARLAHDPLRALRLRLVLLEGERRAGDQRAVQASLRRLGRLRVDRLPGLLQQRVRAGLEGASPTPGSRPGASKTRWPAGGERPGGFARLELVDDILGLFRLCQEQDDEQATLERVCRELRRRLRASAVGVLGADEGGHPLLAGAGNCAALEATGCRAIDTRSVVAPVDAGMGIEAAAPVHWGTAGVGAIVCRWPVDPGAEHAPLAALLGAAATAAAPSVRALLDRRSLPAPPSSSDRGDLLGTSQAMSDLRAAVQRAALVPFPVLIQGESGSGKELVAQAIHRRGPRRHRRFCAFNCAALADDLIEAELFGYARGAFTGAMTDRVGLFEDADGGTLFLDEVGDLSPRAQAKLLRVIQEGEIRRVGENLTRAVDVRIVAAANRPLAEETARGRFRRDLLYRLDVVRISVPSLRDHREDIPLLAVHFWQVAAARAGTRATLSPSLLAALARYDWPGNVRELQNVLASLAVAAPRRGSLGPGHLPASFAPPRRPEAVSLDEARRVFEREFVRAALARSGGQRARAAETLGLTRQGLAKVLARLNLAATPDIDAVEGAPDPGPAAEPVVG